MDIAHKGLVFHALGFWVRGGGKLSRRWSYRNHFCVGAEDCVHRPVVEEMVREGLLVAGAVINDGRDRFFHVTVAGAREAGVLNRFRREDRTKGEG